MTSSTGDSPTHYGFTGERTDPSGLTYLRARYYNPTDGRFINKDPSRLENNLYLYAQGNPVNRIDPTGLFSRELIAKNIDITGFSSYQSGADDWKSHDRWGFYALLLNAQDFDYVRVGSLNLFTYPTNVSWSKMAHIRLLNCETIMIDNQLLSQFYESVVKKQKYPLIWWRDTSAMFYDLSRPLEPLKSFADGLTLGYKSDYPQYRSLSVGVNVPMLNVTGELNVIVDVNGYFHLSYGWGEGATYGIAYTESYLCSTSVCPEAPSSSEVTQAIDGICLNGGVVLIGGINISPLCNLPWNVFNPSTWTSAITYYSGFQVGAGAGRSVTIPLSPLVPPLPGLGWKWAVDDLINGTTYSDIIQMGG